MANLCSGETHPLQGGYPIEDNERMRGSGGNVADERLYEVE